MVRRRWRGSVAGVSPPRAFRCNADGSVAVEFAILGLPFFLIVFMILETAFVLMADMTLENAVAHSSRTVRTGEVAMAAMSEADFRDSMCRHVTLLLSCDQIRFDLRSYSDFASLPDKAPVSAGRLDTGDFRFERGNAGQIMALRAFYEWPLYTDIVHRFLSDLDGGRHLIASVAVFRTEPFN